MIRLEEYLVLFTKINSIRDLEEISEVIIFDYELGCAFIRTEKEKESISEIVGVTKAIKKSDL